MHNLKVFISSIILASLISGVAGASLVLYFNKSSEGVQVAKDGKINVSNLIVEEESAMIEAIEQTSSAVVSIVITKELQQYFNNPFFFFQGLPFHQMPTERNQESEKREVGGGTGFLVSSDGLVLTNRHVVNDPEAEFTVLTSDGVSYFATVIAKDPSNDLAVLQLYTDERRSDRPKKLPSLELGDSDSLKIGSKVIAIGNALTEFSNTTTSGIISGKGRNITAGANGQANQRTNLNNLLQTDAAINPGNSGGPLINLKGQVIGINTAIAQQANGIGFAIPINDVKSAVESVLETGKISRPYLGVRYTELNPALAKELNLPVEYGAYLLDDVQNRVPAVLPGGPADKAGLRSGDIVVAVNEVAIDAQNSLQRLIAGYKVKEKVKLEVLRGKSKVTLNVTLEEFTEEAGR